MNITDPLSTWAADTPAAPAVVTPDGALSYAELDQAVSWTAGAFREAGLTAGAIVAVDVLEPGRHLITALALARIGVGHIAFDGGDPSQLRDSLAERARAIATISDSHDIPDMTGRAPVAVDASKDDNLPFLIMRTSGTETGTPKLARLSHAMAAPRIRAKGHLLPEGPGTRYLALGRLSFNSIKCRAFHCVLTGGCLVFRDGDSDPGALVEFIACHAINYLSCSPMRAAALLDIASGGEILLPGLDALRLGATLIPQPLREAIGKKLTPNLYIAYGLSEIGTVSVATPEQVRNIPGTVGNLLPGVEAEVVDEGDNPLRPETPGRLRVRAPGMIDGYLDSPEQTARAFRDGWFYTGDRVAIGPDGVLIHLGRLDDMMICDGINIDPVEIESVLLRHPAVAEAAAFALPAGDLGDEPVVAAVVRAPVSQDDLLAYCRSRLGAHAPRRVLIVDRLPRNAAGKISKAALKRDAAKKAP